MNSITLDGRVVADAELRYTPGGDPVLSFRVASDIGFGDKKTTNWFACQAWGKRGEALQQYLKKGQQVTVYGQLTLREWQDKEGIKRLSPDVRVSEISLQGGKREDGDGGGHSQEAAPPQRREQTANQQRQETKPAPRMDEMDDDIPF
jgi:single-strand DNA-binding protein